ncbi:hypothetical protein [Frigidibacter sp. MR17.24]|uniref:hypothetical protein n=1 Tax=Frigidibacter sp. MR17.24 TaxID=3127345 RepID=UPI003012EC39
MKVVIPASFSWTSSILPDDYAEWSGGTSYAVGDRAVTAASDQVWQAVQAGSGHDPVADDGTWWVEVGATDRAKPFDQTLGQVVSRPGNTSWTLTMATRASALAIFGIQAISVRVEVMDGATELYDQTHVVVDTSAIVDWWSYTTWEPDYDDQLILTDLPAVAGTDVTITFDAGGGSSGAAEIVAGYLQALGVTQVGTEVGFDDYSTKERDEFGKLNVVQRDFSDVVTFQFAFPPEDTRRVGKILRGIRAVPSVYLADERLNDYGTVVYGIFQNFRIPLQHGLCFAELTVEGLT